MITLAAGGHSSLTWIGYVPLICHGDSHEDVRCFRHLSMSANCWSVSADSYHYLAKPRLCCAPQPKPHTARKVHAYYADAGRSFESRCPGTSHLV
jgi:hypothetical protein